MHGIARTAGGALRGCARAQHARRKTTMRSIAQNTGSTARRRDHLLQTGAASQGIPRHTSSTARRWKPACETSRGLVATLNGKSVGALLPARGTAELR
eukprot:14350453-Alexandrium_andersonii.AAC.1